MTSIFKRLSIFRSSPPPPASLITGSDILPILNSETSPLDLNGQDDEKIAEEEEEIQSKQPEPYILMAQHTYNRAVAERLVDAVDLSESHMAVVSLRQRKGAYA